MAMKPKVALVKDGFLPAGSENVRGRLSLNAITRLKELAGSGWDIEGYSVKSVPNAEPNSIPTVEKVKADPNRVVEIPDATRDENALQAFITDFDGRNKEIGMRDACNLCRASLTYCPCPNPQVWLDFQTPAVVRFKSRIKPLTRIRW